MRLGNVQVRLSSELADTNASLTDLHGKVDSLGEVVSKNKDALEDVQSQLGEIMELKIKLAEIDGKVDEIDKNNQYLNGQVDTILSRNRKQ